jgi:hypothetical protein
MAPKEMTLVEMLHEIRSAWLVLQEHQRTLLYGQHPKAFSLYRLWLLDWCTPREQCRDALVWFYGEVMDAKSKVKA